MKKVFSVLICLLLFFSSALYRDNYSFANSEPEITGQYAVLMDYETGQVLYEKNASAKLYPASTTKAWTAYLVIKYAKDLNATIEIKDFEPVEGSSMYLKNGERFTVKQLLDALLIQSANDTAVVLAEHISGSVENFAKLMNEEAKKIGAKNTHFNNPHGLPDENHYTTAYDMALLARECMNNSVFRNIVKTKDVEYLSNETSEISRHFYNSNKLLNEKSPYYYSAVDGIKTGYTKVAGRCLLTSGIKNNKRLIAAVFKADGDNIYIDTKSLLEYGFNNFSSHTILDKDKHTKTESLFLSKQGELIYKPESSYKVILPNGTDTSDYEFKYELTNTRLPIKKGDKVGYLEIYEEKNLKSTIPLISENNVTSVFGFIGNINFLKTLAIAVVSILVLVILVGFLIRNFIIINKRRKQRRNMFSSRKKY